MSELNNPMRFSTSNRTIDIDNYLHHPDFSEKRVTEIDIKPSEGNIYVHWEEVGKITTVEELKEVSNSNDSLEIALSNCEVGND